MTICICGFWRLVGMEGKSMSDGYGHFHTICLFNWMLNDIYVNRQLTCVSKRIYCPNFTYRISLTWLTRDGHNLSRAYVTLILDSRSTYPHTITSSNTNKAGHYGSVPLVHCSGEVHAVPVLKPERTGILFNLDLYNTNNANNNLTAPYCILP